jgi:uncharacterized membrane protein
MDYKIIQPNKELRACSRQQLNGIWGKMAFAFFIYSLITTLPQFIFWEYSPLHNSMLYKIMQIAILIMAGPFALGFAGYFVKRIRGEEISFENIFDGFNRFFPSFLVWFFTFLLTTLWSCLLIVPGIIKALGYSMAYYILYDNPGMKPLEAIKRSQNMMMGYKWKYFKLGLSFLGWALLGLLTLGIGYLWLYPYIYLANGNFYENLKKNQEKPVMENANTGTDAGQNLS